MLGIGLFTTGSESNSFIWNCPHPFLYLSDTIIYMSNVPSLVGDLNDFF